MLKDLGFAIRSALLAVAMIAAPCIALIGCTTVLPSPTEMGCSADEANNCRIVAAGLIIQGANTTIGEQFDRGVITQPEALKLRAITKKATDALVTAKAAVALAAADTDTQLAALDAVLYELLQAQLVKAGS